MCNNKNNNSNLHKSNKFQNFTSTQHQYQTQAESEKQNISSIQNISTGLLKTPSSSMKISTPQVSLDNIEYYPENDVYKNTGKYDIYGMNFEQENCGVILSTAK